MTDPIKARIQSLCPDIMELKFGCIVKHANRFGIIVAINKYERDDETFTRQIVKWEGEVFVDQVQIIGARWEILGSPITLAVVLRAMEKCGATVSVDTFGDFYGLEDLDNNNSLAHWNLAKDNYDDQTKETQKFIGTLLGVV